MNRKYIFHVDRLGSTMAVTSSTAGATALQHLRYGTYGEVRGRWTGSWGTLAAPPATEYGFTGYESDFESGLQYAGARFYDPELGLFVSLDPARQFASPNSYTGGNPVNLTDPSGAFVDFLIGMLIAAAIGFAAGAINAAIHGASFGMAMRAGLIGAVTAAATAVVAGLVLGGWLSAMQTSLAGWYQSMAATMSSKAASIAASATMAAPGVIYGLTQSDYAGAISLGIGIGIAVAGRGGFGQFNRSASAGGAASEIPCLGPEALSGIDLEAATWGDTYNPMSVAEDREWLSAIYETPDGEIRSTIAIPGEYCNGGTSCSSADPYIAYRRIPSGGKLLGFVHSHGAGEGFNGFSVRDIQVTNGWKRTFKDFLGTHLTTPGGALKFYQAGTLPDNVSLRTDYGAGRFVATVWTK